MILKELKNSMKSCFYWKFNKIPMPTPYYLIETKDLEGNPGTRAGWEKRAARTAGL